MRKEQSTEGLRNVLEPYKPESTAWVLFKVSSYERLVQMQRGLLYFNSLEFFSRLEEATPNPLRNDQTEAVYERFCAGQHGRYLGKLLLEIGEGDERKTFDAGDEAVLTVGVPNPSNVMVFCMSALADDESGKMPNEVNGQLFFDPRLRQFGEHLLVVTSGAEFFRRINRAIAETDGLYGGDYFQGGAGLVQYVDIENHSGHVGLFRKDLVYEWQREYRIALGAKGEVLNEKGALELRIGDISDISEIMEIKPLIDNPVTVRRERGRIVEGVFVPDSDGLT